MAPLTHVLADLRRGFPLLVAATLAGGAVGGVSALRDGESWSASAAILVAARTWENRGAPVRPDELKALLDPEVVEPAAAAAGIDPGLLAGAVSFSQRPAPGLYDVTVTLPDGDAARKAADALAKGVADRVVALREEKLALLGAALAPAYETARKAREEAEAAYLAHVEGGTVERAQAELERAPSATTAAALGRARAERDRLYMALDRAKAEERWLHDARARSTWDLDAREARARVWALAGEPKVRRPGWTRRAVSGAALAFVIAFGGLLAFGEFRRRPAGEPGFAP